MEKEHFKFKLAGKTLVVVDWANVYGWHKSLGWDIDINKLFIYMESYPEVFEQKFYHGVDPEKDWSCKIEKDAKDAGFTVVSKEVKWTPVYLNKQNHFKNVIKELFNVLDGMKITNSGIATKLYDLREKIEGRLSARNPDFDGDGNIQGEHPPYTQEDEGVYKSVYDLIEELDTELKKLNINIDELQKHLQEPVMRMKCDFDVEIARDIFNSSDSFDQLILFSGDGDYAALVEDLLKKDKKVIVIFAKGHKGKEYDNLKGSIFLCPVNKLKVNILIEKNIPPDFSGGRDTDNISKK